MFELPGKGDLAWRAWLESHCLYNPCAGTNAAYLRYRKFSQLDLGVVLVAERWFYLQELLPLERGLVFGNAIGIADHFSFGFMVSSDEPIRQRPIAYARRERDWITGYIDKQLELGVLRQVAPGEQELLFTVGAVLVKGGQTQQDYRLCAKVLIM